MTSFLVSDDGRLTQEGQAALADLVGKLQAQAEPRLLLHFHGGLVSDKKGREIATGLDEGAFGALGDDGWERSYLIWRTGFLETLSDRLRQLETDDLFNRLVDQVLKWAGARVLAAGVARGPLTDGEVAAQRAEPGEPFSDEAVRNPDEIRASVSDAEIAEAESDFSGVAQDDALRALVENDRRVRDIAGQMAKALETQAEGEGARASVSPKIAASLALLDGEVLAEASAAEVEADLDAGARGPITAFLLNAIGRRAAVAGYQVLKRFLKGRDHGLYCTVVEEVGRAFYAGALGTSIWGDMKADAAASFAQGGSGEAILQALAGVAQAKAPAPVRVLITAHSAGAIVACEFVRAAASLPSNVTLDLVFLAPAVRQDLAARSLAAAGARVNAIRIFTMKDELERRDNLDNTVGGKVYSRSLLYLVSGLFEAERGKAYADAPLLGLVRHVDQLDDSRLTAKEREARDAMRAWLQLPVSRWILSKAAGGGGLSTTATTHGTFDQNDETLASIVHIARSGF